VCTHAAGEAPESVIKPENFFLAADEFFPVRASAESLCAVAAD
jgi:hypothetical protein